MEKTEKKYRQRNKQRRNAIRQQLEFYFSDSNLSKDRYLSQLIKNSPDACKFVNGLGPFGMILLFFVCFF